MGRKGDPFPDTAARRWGRTASRRGRRGVGAAGERHRRRRARGALFAVAAVVLTAPSSAALHVSLAKVAVAPPVAGGDDQQLAATITGRVAARQDPTHARVVPARQPAAIAAAAGDTPILPPPVTFDAPPAPPAPPPDALHSAAAATSASGTGVWAVIIGIDDYPGTGADLQASVADADDVDAALASYGVAADRRLVIRDTQATAAVVADAARWLVGRAGPDATAVFFYAGHVRKLGGGREAVVGADGNLVTDVALADLLRPLAAKRTWIAMASCYGGGFDELLAPGRILTAAAGPDSVAYESSELGNSYLVEYMVDRAMREGLAPGSVEQSFAWAVDALRREHPQRVPVQYDDLDGELHLGSPAAPTTPPAPTRSAPPPSPQNGHPAHDEPSDQDDHCAVTIGSIVGCDDQVSGD